MFATAADDTTASGRRQHQVTEVAVTGKSAGSNLQTTEIHKVIVVGMSNVGKTALLQQFMTSHYMAAVCTSFGRLCIRSFTQLYLQCMGLASQLSTNET
jgi:GTP-binding protein EngB required for normal cell division